MALFHPPFHPPLSHPCDTSLTPIHRRPWRTHRGRAGGDAGSRPRNVRGKGWRRRKAVIRNGRQGHPCLIRFRQSASPRVQRGCRGGQRLTGFSTDPRERPGSSTVRASHNNFSSEASHPSGPSGPKSSAAPTMRRSLKRSQTSGANSRAELSAHPPLPLAGEMSPQVTEGASVREFHSVRMPPSVRHVGHLPRKGGEGQQRTPPHAPGRAASSM